MSTPSPSGAGEHDSRSHALALAGLGYKIVPLPTREKYPKGLGEWQKKATCDVAQIERWFQDPELGIGWAMGTQPNGANLAGIDVDVANGKQGWASLRALDVRFNLRQVIRNTVTSVTGSDGRHLIVDTGQFIVNNGKLGEGLDLRGEGGFLVVPPSVHPNGERYRWVDSKAPWEIEPFHVEPGFAEFLLLRPEEGVVPPVPPSASAGVRTQDEDSPADWARANMRIGDLLVEGGWSYSHSHGGDHYWTRPDKSVKEGHSAVLHDEGPLVVWSTSAPAAFWRAGRDARDGSRVLSVFEVYAAVKCQGDIRSAGREIRKLMPRNDRAPGLVLPEAIVSQQSSMEALKEVPHEQATGLNLPDDFWTSRDLLAHIRQAAHNRLVSPDATLIGVLARFAAIVPPSYRLPALVGSEATFDFIGCSVASSSGGKTVANNVAADLLPIQRTDVLVDLPVGSGEGLIQSFLVDELDDDGKRTGRQVVGRQAVHFQVDEGTALMEQQARKGTTIVQTLCSAWSGATLGQANASAETRRIIEAKRVRVSAVINIQTANGHLLLDEKMLAVGLPQRIVFAHAHSTLPPLDQLPAWPGSLDVLPPPIITGQHTVMEILPEIAQEIRQNRYEVATGERVLGPIDGHLGLLRLKLAGLFALLDDRRKIDGSDWSLAGRLIDSSVSVRRLLVDAKTVADRDRLATQGAAQAFRDMAAEDYKERQAIDRLSTSIIAKLPQEGLGTNQLRKLVCNSGTKHRFGAALELAIQRGVLKIVDGVVHKV